MSVYYYEPFFSTNDVNRLFDEASRGFFSDSGRQVTDRENASTADSVRTAFRPKYITEKYTAFLKRNSKLIIFRLDIHENKDMNEITATFLV